tara:strand:- start:209 stop:1276 length:1068 start_codon:yes stop_codon:yes gene_type:complete
MIYRQPADQKHGPNCGPTSVAVLTANPLADVMAFIKADCRKAATWKGSTHNRGGRYSGENSDCFKALAHFGANPKVETGLEDQHRGRQLCSVVADLPADRAYFVCTGGHAQAVVDGRVFDQNTAPEGDAVYAYWGRRKKVNVIFSVDRLNSNEENTIMDNPIAVLPLNLSDAVLKVAGFEAVAASSVSAIKGLTAEKNGAKVAAYAHLIAGLVAHKIRKGTAQAGEFKAALIEQGVSKACAKRYLENGQKAKALAWVKAAGTDADAILAAFEENGVKTEQDLVNIVSPKAVLTAAEELAAKALALTDSDDEALQALLDAAVLINPGCADVATTLVAALAAHGEATVAQAPVDIAA